MYSVIGTNAFTLPFVDLVSFPLGVPPLFLCAPQLFSLLLMPPQRDSEYIPESQAPDFLSLLSAFPFFEVLCSVTYLTFRLAARH